MADMHVLLTGAASGIGRGIALSLSSNGFSLTLVDCNEAGLEETKAICDKITSKKIEIVKCDITNDDDVKKCMKTALDAHGSLYGLVNCAGIARYSDISDPTKELQILDQHYRTNFRGPYLMTTLAVPHLVESQGAIVTISSINALRATPDMLAYSCFKSALTYFSRTLASELAPKKVRVNTVSPGHIPTNLQNTMGVSRDDVEKQNAAIADTVPLRRNGTPEDIANVVAFLLSDKASYVTGVDIPVTGGLHEAAFVHN